METQRRCIFPSYLPTGFVKKLFGFAIRYFPTVGMLLSISTLSNSKPFFLYSSLAHEEEHIAPSASRIERDFKSDTVNLLFNPCSTFNECDKQP